MNRFCLLFSLIFLGSFSVSAMENSLSSWLKSHALMPEWEQCLLNEEIDVECLAFLAPAEIDVLASRVGATNEEKNKFHRAVKLPVILKGTYVLIDFLSRYPNDSIAEWIRPETKDLLNDLIRSLVIIINCERLEPLLYQYKSNIEYWIDQKDSRNAYCQYVNLLIAFRDYLPELANKCPQINFLILLMLAQKYQI